MKSNVRLELSFVKEFFEKAGCKLLATEYVNCSTLMPYICSCGTESKICWSKFNQGKRCSLCGINKIKNKLKLDFNAVKDIFEKGGCLLLVENYENNIVPMLYRCICGNESKISLSHFKSGKRCKKCSSARRKQSINK
jgi:hypothetical protein